MAIQTYTFVGPLLPDDWAVDSIKVKDAVTELVLTVARGEQFTYEETRLRELDRWHIELGPAPPAPVLIPYDDPTLAELLAPTTALITAHTGAVSGVHGTGVNVTSDNIGAYAPAPDLSGLATHAEVTSAVSAHEADTTNVHGIADTAVLVVTSDARLSDQRTPLNGSVTNAKVAAGAAIAYSKLALNGSVQVADLAFDPATQVELDAAVAPLATSAALTAHTTATTSVHGIADTSKLVVTNPGVVQTIQPTADVVPLVIKAKAGQTANLLALQDSTSVTVFSVASNGSFTASSDSKSSGSLTANVSTANQIQLGWSTGVTYSPSVSFGSADDTRITRTAAGELTLTANGANTTRFIVRGGASQSTNLQDWMQSGGTAVAGVDNSGNFSGPGMKAGVVGPASQSGLQASDARIYRSAAGEFTVDTSGSNPTKLIVKGTASQSTTPLFQIQNSAGAVQVTVDNTGVIDASGGVFRSQFGSTRTAGVMNYANTAGFLTAADATHDFLLTGSATTKVPLAVRGAASQTASLQEWQDSTPTVQAFVDPAGRIVSKAEVKAFNGATQMGNGSVTFNVGSAGLTWSQPGSARNYLTYQGLGNQSGTLIVKKGVSTQTDNLQEWQDDTGAAKSWITPTGGHYFGTAGSINGAYIDGGVLNAMQGALVGTNSYVGRLTVKTLFASDPGVVVRGFTAQSADLLQIQDPTGASVLAKITAAGTIHGAGDVEAENKLAANVLTANRVRVGFDGVSGIAGMALGSGNDVILNRLAAGVVSFSKANTGYPTPPTMDGFGMIFANVTTAPSTNPVGGPVVYAEGGALKVRGTGGTITTLAPA